MSTALYVICTTLLAWLYMRLRALENRMTVLEAMVDVVVQDDSPREVTAALMRRQKAFEADMRALAERQAAPQQPERQPQPEPEPGPEPGPGEAQAEAEPGEAQAEPEPEPEPEPAAAPAPEGESIPAGKLP